MKWFIWPALAVLLLSLAACGRAASTGSQTESQQAPAVEDAETEENASTAPEQEAEAEPEADVEESAEASAASDIQPAGDSSPAAEQSAGHDSAACEDPFAGVENVRFSPDLWTTAGIKRYVDPEIVDPDSDLATNFCNTTIDYNEILSGGPPPDGIPPIDNPQFESIAAGDEWLADQQPVIALAQGDEAKAYPLAILTWHEIANDEIDGTPVAVTFCPLCNAAIVFNRQVDGDVLRFGVSGNLRNSDLVMWDNKTLSWWQQFTGEAIVGNMTGTKLEMIPAPLVSWKDFKEAYPEGEVMVRSGSRNYGSNPYTGYDSTTSPFLFLGTPDDRLRATERVLGYHKGDTAVAYPLSAISRKKLIEDSIDGQNVVIFFEPGQVSALDNASIERSKEVGSASMYIPEVDGRQLTFMVDGSKILDNETGSTWNVFGQAIDGPLAGSQLQPMLSHTHFWFAWAAFRPDTELYQG